MPRKTLPAILVAALGSSLAITSPANADPSTYREWINHCTTGAFRACMSLQINFVHRTTAPNYYGVTEWTDVEIRVANLQGRNDWMPNSGAYPIYGMQLSGLSHQGNGPPGCCGLADDSPEGGARAYGNTGSWEVFGWDEYHQVQTLLYSDEPGFVPILGCDIGGWGSFGGYQTCSGFVLARFTADGTWSFTNASIATVNGAVLGTDTAQVTPEPVTMVLLGTGLFGIGAARLRRKKKDFDESC